MKTNSPKNNESKLHEKNEDQFNDNLKRGANGLQQGKKVLRRRFLH